MEYNSDYEIRLNTLLSLGYTGDTNFDSVYSIDLEILKLTEQGGGGGMDYNAIKAALAASGVTEILFNDGDSSVTLDYAKVMQIGQGGDSNYLIVDSLDELSGVTDPKDGMLAYLKEHTAQEEKLVVVTDFYSENNDNKLYINIEWNDSNTTRINEWYGGNNALINDWYGRFVNINNNYFDDIHNHRNELPTPIEFNNGAVGTLLSNVDGESFPDRWEMVNTFWFDKFDGEFPTITITTDEGVTMVQTSVTAETVTVSYSAKGYWKYYSDVDKWLPYEVNWDNLTSAEKNVILNQFADYMKPFTCYRTVDDYGYSPRKFEAVGNGYRGEDSRFDSINFSSNPRMKPSAQYGFMQFKYSWNNNYQMWIMTGDDNCNFPRTEEIGGTIDQVIRRPNSNAEGSFYDGCIYSIPISGNVSGTIYSTYVASQTAQTWDENCIRWYNQWNGATAWIDIRPDGYIKAKIGRNLTFHKASSGATINDDWWILDYCWQEEANLGQGAWGIAAVRAYDADANGFNVELFISTTTEGYQNAYGVQINTDKSYTWSATTSQTINVQPTIYSTGRFGNDNGLGRTLNNMTKKTVILPQAEYDVLAVKDNNTIYFTY